MPLILRYSILRYIKYIQHCHRLNIGGIKGNGSDYYSDNATNVPATDSGGVPDGESPK
ncbi:MAG: hypothetical protein IJ738_01485 [Alphaproteobacteria bacterium]|nr:hypothetical protein [Alphaproteobacteria bacterium]